MAKCKINVSINALLFSVAHSGPAPQHPVVHAANETSQAGRQKRQSGINILYARFNAVAATPDIFAGPVQYNPC